MVYIFFMLKLKRIILEGMLIKSLRHFVFIENYAIWSMQNVVDIQSKWCGVVANLRTTCYFLNGGYFCWNQIPKLYAYSLMIKAWEFVWAVPELKKLKNPDNTYLQLTEEKGHAGDQIAVNNIPISLCEQRNSLLSCMNCKLYA